jgi:hemerythrin-like metal-binding protein
MEMPINAPPPCGLSDAFNLGYGPMDKIHHEFGELVMLTQQGKDTELMQNLKRLGIHLRAHFDAENGWMTESDFPAGVCHIDEHAAVLHSLEEVTPKVTAGDYALGRRFVAELVSWFPGHADYLDSALAHWLCKQKYGGKPVVLTRLAQCRH